MLSKKHLNVPKEMKERFDEIAKLIGNFCDAKLNRACIGNGNNDARMFEVDELSISVLGDEGAALNAIIFKAVIVVKTYQPVGMSKQ